MGQKASRYLVVSEAAYTDGGGQPVRLVLNTRTSRVSTVDDAVARTLGRETLPAAIAEQLSDPSILVPSDRDELTDVLDEQRARARSLASLNYVLVPAGFCNMGCEYCGQVHVRGKSTANHRDAVRDRVLRGINRPSTEEVRIGWFGNEPLLSYAIVRELAAQFVEAADAGGVRYTSTLSTGGSLLTLRRLRALYEECRIHTLRITIDPQRPYHRILSTLSELASDEFPLLRLMIHSDLADVDQGDAFLDAAVAAGLNRPMFEFDLREAPAWRRGEQRFAAAEPRWLRRMHEVGLVTGNLIPAQLTGPLCPAVTRTAEVISSSGGIFSCTEHPLVSTHEQDDVLELVEQADHDRQRPAGRYDDWHDRVNRGEQKCSGCVFLPVCGGSCPKRWGEGTSACPSYTHNIQQRLDLVAARSGLVPCS
ncbi:radical SAM/SPASM domain-containing protein [Kutzneria sp. CA-103260]|uniref:radical SAM/SPASM domain-containing protein n=1 Tax=Kutzneria sp. CA-103260 TaxID=2802641 RepID=UPI001BA93CEB|nr:SPASM domain-containing protein [Kutzneria sp. CA-103260]QUQ63024.1 Radical SAM superfamily protein [Kutzneria sp. CA-103260]